MLSNVSTIFLYFNRKTLLTIFHTFVTKCIISYVNTIKGVHITRDRCIHAKLRKLMNIIEYRIDE